MRVEDEQLRGEDLDAAGDEDSGLEGMLERSGNSYSDDYSYSDDWYAHGSAVVDLRYLEDCVRLSFFRRSLSVFLFE